MAQGIIILLLLAAVAVLGVKLYRVNRMFKSFTLRAGSAGDQTVSAREVPEKLKELFSRSYGLERKTDSEIAVCFRYAKFHKIFDTEEYPVDCKILMHREAYLGDRSISKELGELITGLQKAGLEFVAVFGDNAAATTREFETYLQQPGATQHGEWKPSKELQERFATKLGRDSKGRFASVGA